MRLRPGLRPGPRCRGAYSVPQTSYLALRGPIRGEEGEGVKGKEERRREETGACEEWGHEENGKDGEGQGDGEGRQVKTGPPIG